MIKNTLLPLILILLLIIGCGKKSPIAGNSVNTGNTISGNVINGEGDNMAGVVVLLFPNRYDPVKDSLVIPDSAVTDANGNFVFSDLESSRYTLQLSNPGTSAKATINNVALLPDENLELEPVALLETGKIFLSLNEGEFQAGGYVYIPGSNVFTQVQSEDIQQGVLVLQEVPATDYTDIIYVSPQSEKTVNLISDTLALQPNQEEIVIPNIHQNVVKGVVKNESGSLVANVSIRLFPLNYNPNSDSALIIKNTFTNSGGIFEFLDVNPGEYNLLLSSLNTNETAVIQNQVFSRGDTIHLGLIPVKPSSSIEISLKTGDYKPNDYIYIPGTDISVTLTSQDISNGKVVLTSIPPGVYDKLYHVDPITQDINNIINEKMVIEPNQKFLIGIYHEWKYSKEFLINTTSSALDIQTDVVNFPLLVKLDSSNFDFTQASLDGSDIRFSKSDKFTELTYELESWDVQNKSAVIWVKLDTIFGNNSTQSFIMYWGNSSAVSISNSNQVFPREQGYQAVWHFSGIDIVNEPLTRDASGDNPGRIFGDLRNLSKDNSVINRGFFFNGIDQEISTTLSDSAIHVFTYSFWMKTDSTGGVLMGFSGDDKYIDRHVYMGDDGRLHFGVFPDTNLSDTIENGARRIVSSPSPVADNNWHLITASLSPEGQKLYVDGNLVGHDPQTIQGGYWYRAHWRVGRTIQTSWEGRSVQEYYHGEMDEVRIWNVEKSSAWIKLSYETQKPDFKGFEVK